MQESSRPDGRTMAPGQLVDGSPPMRPSELLGVLEALNMTHRTVRHPPVFTVEEARQTRAELPGAHVKNLFLRNRKGRMWLVTCLADRPVNLKRLAGRIQAKNLSFGSEARLMKHLGLRPGSVTTFGVVNDRQGQVAVVLDRALLEYPLVNLHPLVNDQTTAIAPADLLRFLEHVDHPPTMLDFPDVDADQPGVGS